MAKNKTFDDLVFESKLIGQQAKLTFPNNWGVSVIIGEHTYGGNRGLWELAVLGKTGLLNYSTKVTDDVLGYCTKEDITNAMKTIQKLSKA